MCFGEWTFRLQEIHMPTLIGLKNPNWDLTKSSCKYNILLWKSLEKAYVQQWTPFPPADGWIMKLFNDKRNAETDELPLMSGPGPVLMILAMYLLYVLKLGPHFMRKREPHKLKTTLVLYNIFQVAISAYLAVYYLRTLMETGLTPKKCYMNDDKTRREILLGIWMYFAAKVTELLDTIFFVLRKKDSQVTFLHLYHHSVMVFGTWALLKYYPCQNLMFIGFLNSLVHVFMYTYYGLSALGPHVAKYLTWKKYMTTFQLVQFVSIIVQWVISVKVSDCPPAKGPATFVACNTFFILVLFLNFYRQNYKKKEGKMKRILLCEIPVEELNKLDEDSELKKKV